MAELQVRGDLIEYQHDALISFHSRYSRKFVSKLLMRLAENMITEYPPNLANFLIDDPMPGAAKQKVTIRIRQDEHPAMWEFYRSLPHGGKSAILMNVLNAFVQAAEVDRSVMEKAFWGLKPQNDREPVSNDGLGHMASLKVTNAGGDTNQIGSEEGRAQDTSEWGNQGIENNQVAAMEQAAVEPQLEEEEPHDPLMDVVISL